MKHRTAVNVAAVGAIVTVIGCMGAFQWLSAASGEPHVFRTIAGLSGCVLSVVGPLAVFFGFLFALVTKDDKPE